MVSNRRNGIYRGIFASAVGLALVGAAPAPNQSNGNETSQATGKIAKSLVSIAAAQAKIAETTEAGEYQQPCPDGQANSKSDLCAQWYAARAARDAADWAFWALIVGLVGSVGIVIALWLTIQSNWIARDSAKRQLRAYLAIEKIEFLENWKPLPPYKISKPDGVHIRITVKNFGQSPALNVTLSFDEGFETTSEISPQPIEWFEPSATLSIAPGHVHHSIIERDQDYPESFMRSGVSSSTIRGWIVYRDVWGKTHHTSALWFSTGEDFSANRFSAHHLGNEST